MEATVENEAATSTTEPTSPSVSDAASNKSPATTTLETPSSSEAPVTTDLGSTAEGGGLLASAQVWEIVGVGGGLIVHQHRETGEVAAWEMSGTQRVTAGARMANDPVWQVQGVGDLDGDRDGDIVLRNTTTGDIAVWTMNGTTQQ